MTRRQEALHRARYDTRKKTLGEDHKDTLDSANYLAILLKQTGRKEEAEPLFRATYDARKSKLGEDHRDTLCSAGNLALLLMNTGRVEEAERDQHAFRLLDPHCGEMHSENRKVGLSACEP